jgi:hypothetical protein
VVASAPNRQAACELRSRYLAGKADAEASLRDVDPYPILEDHVWEHDDSDDRAFVVPDRADAAVVDDRLDTLTLRETLFETAVEERDGVIDPRTEWHEQLVDERLATQQGTAVGETLVDDADAPDWPDEAGFGLCLPGEDSPLADVEITASAKISEWGDDLAAQLLDAQTAAVATAAADVFNSDIDPRAPRVWAGWLVKQVGVTALDGDYARGIARLALEDGLDEQTVPTEGSTEIVDEAAEIRELLTSLVAPGGAYGGGIDALVNGACASLTLAETQPTVVVRFDAMTWRAADARTGRRALNVLRALSRVADVHLVINSPELADLLANQYDLDDAALHTSLDTARSQPIEEDATPAYEEHVWEALADLDPWRNGYGRLLVNLPADGARYQRHLHDDPDVDLSRSAVSRYWPALADAGLVAKETADGRHQLRLTARGEAATQFIDPADGSLRPPEEQSLGGQFTGPPHARIGAVCRAQQGRKGGEDLPARSVEEWVADTPAADHSRDWVRWLWGPDSHRDGFVAHHRYAAATRGTVSCVDARIREFDDPRITYLSSLEDEVLVLAQWGGPLATLARVVNALLSHKAFSKCINEETLGTEFDELERGDGTALSSLDASLWDLIVDGMQHGWFGEDEHHWDGFRDRISGVRALCLDRLADVAGTDQWDARAELMRDLHGLLASATQLYRAAGYDIVVNVRCPDTANIVTDEVRHRDFCDFWRFTVPKHAAYDSSTGIHSHYRQTHETRTEKRRWRHELGFDEDAPESDPTVQWVLTGRTATDLRADIERAVDEEVAERVAAGTEAAPYLDVEVTNGCSFSALKGVIRRLARVKGKQLADATTAEHARHAAAVDRLARLAIAATGSGDRPTQGNPMALAEGLALIGRSDSSRSWLSLGDVEQACAAMSAREFLPDVGSRAATRCVQALLASDEPLTKSDLQERARLSGSTWERINRTPASKHDTGDLHVLEELGIVQRVTEDGTTARIATLAPWWSEIGDRDASRGETPHCSVTPGSTRADVVFAVADALGVDLDYEVFAWPSDLAAAYQMADVEAWRAWIWAAVASGDDYKTGPPEVRNVRDHGQTRLGIAPGSQRLNEDQDQLATNAPAATGGPKVTDGGRKGGSLN